jgi:hypothetical protein
VSVRGGWRIRCQRWEIEYTPLAVVVPRAIATCGDNAIIAKEANTLGLASFVQELLKLVHIGLDANDQGLEGAIGLALHGEVVGRKDTFWCRLYRLGERPSRGCRERRWCPLCAFEVSGERRLTRGQWASAAFLDEVRF